MIANKQDAFAALADPNRREIVRMLARKGELSVAEIGNAFSISTPAISQHLKVLREAQMVSVSRVAQRRIYRVNQDGMDQVSSWLEEVRSLWSKRLDALDSYLKTIKVKEKKNAKTKRSK